jgi:hypothetical protein
MGGWLEAPAEGLPPWGPEMDWNVQCDTCAALTVAEAADLTLVTLPVTLHAHLTAAELPRLAASGPLGDLLAPPGEGHGEDHNMAELGREHAALPDDQWQPVANGTAAKTAQLGKTVVVGCDRLPKNCHGKEGSPVRVRQRASQSTCKAGIFVRLDVQKLQRAVGMELFMELPESECASAAVALAGCAGRGSLVCSAKKEPDEQ